MSKAALITVDLVDDGDRPSAWLLRPPPATADDGSRSCHRVVVIDDGVRPGDRRTLLDELDRLAARDDLPPLMLLSGHPARQLALLHSLRWSPGPEGPASTAGRFPVRAVCCVSAQHRPFWPPESLPLHGLIVDSPPTSAERAHWSRALGPELEGRVGWVPCARPSFAVDATGRLAGAAVRGASEERVVLFALEADAWMASGILAFKTWAQARYQSCAACGATVLDRFDPNGARFQARAACPYCGGGGCGVAGVLRRPDQHPEARLVVLLDGEDEPSPDPEVLGRWLALSEQLEVRRLGGKDRQTAGSDAFDDAAVALVLGDPAYPDARLDLARSSGARVVSNQGGVLADGSPVLATNSGWDFRGQVASHPSTTSLVRALESATRRWREGTENENGRPEPRRDDSADAADRDSRQAAWDAVLHRLSVAPERRRGCAALSRDSSLSAARAPWLRRSRSR